MERTTLLLPLGWPENAECGSLSWSREEGDRNGMHASLTLSSTGELVMSSQSHFNGRIQPRFNAHVPTNGEHARVSMPGYDADKMPVAQAISLFRAHVDSLQVAPIFRRGGNPSPRI